MDEDFRTVNGIPESDYWRLAMLMGRTNADKFIYRVNHNYKAIVYKIYILEIGNWLKSVFGKG